MSFAVLIKVSTLENVNAPKAIIIDQKRTMIGRHSEVYMDTSKGKEISKHHALMMHERVNEKLVWLLEDRRSLNGTFVNGRKIVRQILHNKDEIIFGGGSSLKFSDLIVSSELSECCYRFFTPEVPISFSHCTDLHISLNEEEETEECCICFVALHKMENLPCGHFFCSHCLNHWMKVCAKSMRPSLCPICRRPFTKSDISQEDISIKDGKFTVNSIVPLLKLLKITSIDEINIYKINEKWTDQTKQNFWRIYEMMNDHRSVQRIFRHFLGMTLDSVYNANSKELHNMNENLDGDPGLTGDELRHEVFARFCVMLLHAREIKKSKHSRSKHRSRNVH